MASPSWSLQTAIYDRLTDELDVPVFDNVTQADTFPYVIIGQDDIDDDSTSCGDGFDILALIRCFADGPARKATKELTEDVFQALKAKLFISGFSVDLQTYEGTVFQAVESGLRHQGIIRMRFKMQPTT